MIRILNEPTVSHQRNSIILMSDGSGEHQSKIAEKMTFNDERRYHSIQNVAGGSESKKSNYSKGNSN